MYAAPIAYKDGVENKKKMHFKIIKIIIADLITKETCLWNNCK
jgi:hypothetical protein